MFLTTVSYQYKIVLIVNGGFITPFTLYLKIINKNYAYLVYNKLFKNILVTVFVNQVVDSL